MDHKESPLSAPTLFIDCQTTGAHPRQGRILEIAWSIGSCNSAGNLRSYLIVAGDEALIPWRIQELTGIRDADVIANGRPIDEMREALRADLAGARVAVAHFAQFERPFLHDLFDGVFPLEVFCTHRIAKKLLPGLPVKGVRGIAGYYGHPMYDEPKRASSHVQATACIWAGVTKELAEQGVSTFGELEAWLDAKPQVLKSKTRAKVAYEYPMDRAKRLAFPDQPGVYRMLAKDGKVLYVGKATSLRSRVNSYFRGRKGRDHRKLEMLTQTWDIHATACASPLEAALLENDEIKRWDPPYNVNLKARSRKMAFFARDFRSFKCAPDAEHPIGPFSSARELEPLLLLAESLQHGAFSPVIFWEPLDSQLLAQSFALYLKGTGLQTEDLKSPRSLMAQGMREWRAHLRTHREEEAVLLLDTEDAEDGVERAPTTEELAEKFGRLLRRAARAYAVVKSISTLLDATVQFVDRGAAREIVPAHPSKMRSHRWEDRTIGEYDGMKVLLSELARVSAAGGSVCITPSLRLPILGSRGSR